MYRLITLLGQWVGLRTVNEKKRDFYIAFSSYAVGLVDVVPFCLSAGGNKIALIASLPALLT